ncbi:hypothetical protein [Bradyrhizobium sp. USDA 4452]
MDEFQRNIDNAKSATSEMTQFAVKKFIDLNSSIIASAGTAGKLVVAIRDVQRALLPIAAGVLVVVEAFKLMGYMTDLAKERIEEFNAIAEKAGKTGLSTDAFQRLTKSGEQLKLTVEQVNDLLDRFADKSKDKLGGSDLQKRIDDLVGYGNFGGNAGVAGVANAIGTNDKLRATVDLITQALDQGERLAALDLADKVFGRDVADKLRANSGFLREMLDSADKMSAQKIISEEDVSRALDLKNRMDEVQKILAERWKPIQDDLAKLGMNYHESWVDIVQDLAQAVNYANQFYQALKQVPDWFANRIGNASIWKSLTDASGALGLNSTPDGLVLKGQPGFDGTEAGSPAGRTLAAGLRNRAAVERSMQDAIDVQTRVRGDRSKAPPQKEAEDNSRDQFETTVDQLTKRIALLNADTMAVGQNVGVRAQLRAEFELLNSIMRDGGEVTQDQINKYETLRATMSAQNALTAAGIQLTGEHAQKFLQVSSAVGTMTTALQQAKDKFEGLDESLRFGGNELVNVLDQATQKGFKFSDAMAQIMRNVTKQILQAAITGEGAFAKLLGLSSGNGGVGGLFGLLSGNFGSSNLTAGASWSSGLGAGTGGLSFPMFAGGTDFAPGGPAIVGERGPEIVNLPRGSQVIPNEIARGIGGGGNVTINNYTDGEPSVQKKPNGDMLITIRRMVDDAVGDSLSSGSGRRVLGDQFGVKPFMGQ